MSKLHNERVARFGVALLMSCATPPDPVTLQAHLGEQRVRAQPSEAAGPREGSSSEPETRVEFNAAPACEQMVVPGFRPHILCAAPAGAPLLVAAHGAGGTPLSWCDYWSTALRGRAFVLCPAGRPLGEEGYYFANHHELAREVEASLGSFWTRFPDTPREGALYFGFSQGATMGALGLREIAFGFAGVLLVEGGDREWSHGLAKALAAKGTRKVLWGCGRRSCGAAAKASLRIVERAGMSGKVVEDFGAGHSLSGELEAGVFDAWPWLTEGFEPWEGLVP